MEPLERLAGRTQLWAAALAAASCVFFWNGGTGIGLGGNARSSGLETTGAATAVVVATALLVTLLFFLHRRRRQPRGRQQQQQQQQAAGPRREQLADAALQEQQQGRPEARLRTPRQQAHTQQPAVWSRASGSCGLVAAATEGRSISLDLPAQKAVSPFASAELPPFGSSDHQQQQQQQQQQQRKQSSTSVAVAARAVSGERPASPAALAPVAVHERPASPAVVSPFAAAVHAPFSSPAQQTGGAAVAGATLEQQQPQQQLPGRACGLTRRPFPPHLSTVLDSLPFLNAHAKQHAVQLQQAAPLQQQGPGSLSGPAGGSRGSGSAGGTAAQSTTPRGGSAPATAVASWDQLRSELTSLSQQMPLEELLPGMCGGQQPTAAQAGPQQQQQQQLQQQRVGSDGGSSPQRATPEGPPLSEWEVSPNELEICRRPDGSLWQIGAGGFGRVYKAMRFGVQPVAVKVLAPAAEARYSGQDDFRREMELLKACKDPNIVSFLGASLSHDFTLLVLELCEGGALNANLRAGRISWYKRGKQIAVDVARGLAYLHGRRLVHMDLKSGNILLDRHGHAKIADLGLARIISQELSAVTANVGTLDWAAPEVLLGLRCTEKADIYSFGVCLWELSSGEAPVRGRMRALLSPQDCPAEVARLVEDCMSPDPTRRPTAQQLVERLLAAPAAPPTSAAPAVVAAAATAAAAAAGGVASEGRAGIQMYTPSRPPRSSSLACLSAAGNAHGQQGGRSTAAGTRRALDAAAAGGSVEEQVGLLPRSGSSQSLPERPMPSSAASSPAGRQRRHHYESELQPALMAAEMMRALSSPPELHPGDVYGLGLF